MVIDADVGEPRFARRSPCDTLSESTSGHGKGLAEGWLDYGASAAVGPACPGDEARSRQVLGCAARA